MSVAVAVLLGKIASQLLVLPNISLIFLAAVLFCAVQYGVWSAIFSAVLSFLAYNFFFIEPLYTLTIASPHELLALLIFLLVAILTGGLAGRVREQSDAARRRVHQTQTLFDFSRKLSATAKLDDVLWAVASQLASAIRGETIVVLAEGGELVIKAAFPPEDTMGPSEWTAARWASERGETAGRMSTTLPNAKYQFRPLRTSRSIAGAIGLKPGGDSLSAEDERIVQALIDQTSVAIERTLLVDEAARAQANAESERLRSALLSSISHDLRTPLSSILGAVTSLRSLGGKMPAEARDDLLATIEEEAGRLSRFVSNLLDMTRVESGAVDVKRDWIDVADAVHAAIRRARKVWPNRPIETAIARDLPLVQGESALFEQVMFNLLDNANKYSNPGTPTQVKLAAGDEGIVVTVTDEGPGISESDLPHVFEKFYRARGVDGRSPGTGLGLAICRGIVTAMGGSISVQSPVRNGRGTSVTIRLPASHPVLTGD
jgi:two-component system sensor histidine kinase KdpD